MVERTAVLGPAAVVVVLTAAAGRLGFAVKVDLAREMEGIVGRVLGTASFWEEALTGSLAVGILEVATPDFVVPEVDCNFDFEVDDSKNGFSPPSSDKDSK